jgi:hypothetical protein
MWFRTLLTRLRAAYRPPLLCPVGHPTLSLRPDLATQPQGDEHSQRVLGGLVLVSAPAQQRQAVGRLRILTLEQAQGGIGGLRIVRGDSE